MSGKAFHLIFLSEIPQKENVLLPLFQTSVWLLLCIRPNNKFCCSCQFLEQTSEGAYTSTWAIIDDPIQGVTHANFGNLFATGRRPLSAIYEPMVFITRFEVEAMLRREKEQASISSIRLDLKPPYDTKISAKLYRMEYITRQLQVWWKKKLASYSLPL